MRRHRVILIVIISLLIIGLSSYHFAWRNQPCPADSRSEYTSSSAFSNDIHNEVIGLGYSKIIS
jgi:hypothetical protein